MINFFQKQLHKLKEKALRFKQALIGILGGVLLTTSLGAIDVSQMTKIDTIGERAVYYFDCNGVTKTSFSTAEDFNERFIEKPKRGEREDFPQIKDCVYKGGQRSMEFTTPDGFIHPNEYAETTEVYNGVTSSRVFFMTSDKRFYNWTKEDFEAVKSIP